MAETPVNLERWTQIVSKTWADKDFRKRLLADPAAVLKEHGVQTPPGLQFRVVENTDKVCHLVLPNQPSGELSDDELEQASGGLAMTCFVPPSPRRLL